VLPKTLPVLFFLFPKTKTDFLAQYCQFLRKPELPGRARNKEK
jgi:hypothetical protein